MGDPSRATGRQICGLPSRREPARQLRLLLQCRQYSFSAARQLLIRAHETGSLIEGMVLYVSLIDAYLRIALVLDKQLAGSSLADTRAYIEQVPGGPRFTERAIYTEAHSRSLIDDALKAEIADLYEQRNAMIHRFFLTDLKYVDLGSLLDRYEVVYEQCAAVIEELEVRQVREGKGMTVEGPRADRDEVDRAIKAKLGFRASDGWAADV
jgi:hypothetical protein